MNAGERLWSPVLDTVKPARIDAPCFAKKPDRWLNCTEPPDHDGDHFHCYSQTRWTNTGNDPQW